MAWIEGKLERTYIIEAPYDDVVAFFCDPAAFKAALLQVEEAEEIEPGVWHWTLQEKKEKGITFQGIYTVEYTRDGDTMSWETRDGGTMRSSGASSFVDKGGSTEVTYAETIAADLPIPRLAAKIFRPIVAREVTGGVGEFLDVAKSILEQGS